MQPVDSEGFEPSVYGMQHRRHSGLDHKPKLRWSDSNRHAQGYEPCGWSNFPTSYSPAQSWTEDTRSRTWYVTITLQDYASGAIWTHSTDLEGRGVNHWHYRRVLILKKAHDQNWTDIVFLYRRSAKPIFATWALQKTIILSWLSQYPCPRLLYQKYGKASFCANSVVVVCIETYYH